MSSVRGLWLCFLFLVWLRASVARGLVSVRLNFIRVFEAINLVSIVSLISSLVAPRPLYVYRICDRFSVALGLVFEF